MGGKCTKLRGLPSAQQPRDTPPKVIRKSLPTIARHEEKPRLPITEGRWKINDEVRLSIPGYKLVISKLLGLFQMVEMDELVKHDHIPISYDRPNHHAAYAEFVVQITMQLMTILHEFGISCSRARFK